MLRKTSVLSFILLFVCISVFMLSCKQEPINTVTQTPTIRGSVSIPEGSGLSGSDFYVRVMEGEKAVYTGKASSDGSFSVSGLKENTEYSILLTTEQPGDVQSSSRAVSRDSSTSGYGGWLSNVAASISEQSDIGIVKVKPLGTIKGKVVRDGAEDGYDTTVYIPGTSYLAMTDEEGNFSIFNVPQATYRLRIISTGYMARMVDNVVLYSANDNENPVTNVPEQLLIKNAGNLVGTVTKTGSGDHSGITVMLSNGENTYTGNTKVDGSLLISGIIPGTYSATISSSGFITQAVEGIKIEAAKNTTFNPISLIANGGSFTGSVVMNDGGEKAGVLVTARSSDDKYSYTTSSDVEGKFLITNVFPGSYTLMLSKIGYAIVTRADILSVAGQESNTGSIALNSLYGSVSGKVSLEDSVDNSGVIITLTFTADTSIVKTAVSGADGTYSISNLTDAGQYSVAFSKDGYVSNKNNVVTVELGQNQVIYDVSLRSLASKITGTAKLAETEDYTGISILLKAKDDSLQYDATTDQQGNYVMARVNPGEYTLTVSKTGYVSKTIGGIIVESSTEKELDDVALIVGSRSVTGSITAELKTDYSGFLVTATNLADEKKVYSAITNTSGAYTLAEMVPGEYQIVVSHTGYRTLTLPTVNVVEGITRTIETSNVEINRGTIYGKATLEGRTSSAGVKVELLQGTVVYDTQYTDGIGDYSFYVPQGNYSGVRFSLEDFRSESNQDVMALFADNYVRVPDVELLATHNTVSGVVDVFKGLEDVENSNVTLSFDNNTQITPVVTDEDGAFVFRHVPVSDSKYYLRIKRENCSDIVLQVSVQAADEIYLGVISIYSNTGTIKGQVVLDGEYDSSGILVAVDTGKEVLTTFTDVTGRYELGGIPAGRVFTVTYSKTGWDNATVQIDPALEALEVREMDGLTLTDSIAPVLESIIINSGSNTTASKSVSIQINASDNGGSGITLMQYSWTDNFSLSEWKNYNPNKTLVIPTEDNGQKTLMLRVRDKFGNMSEIKTDSIELVDQIKVYHGTLAGDDLNWTKAKSPIVITGDITIPTGMTLLIEAGVDIFFDGYFSICVDGNIQAIGSEDEQIFFCSTENRISGLTESEGYYGSWGGIKCGNNPLNVVRKGSTTLFVSGSIIAYSTIDNTRDGISGILMLDHCSVLSKGNAIVDFYGSVIDCYVIGAVKLIGSLDSLSWSYIYGNRFYSLESEVNRFHIQNTLNNCLFYNNYINGYEVILSITTGVSNCTFDECFKIYFFGRNPEVYSNCEIINCKAGIMFPGNTISKILFSNLYNNSSDYVIDTNGKSADVRASNKVIAELYDNRIDLKYNYWGDPYTNILSDNEKNGYTNNSFIFDYYDDFSLSKTDLSEYRSEPWPLAGYKGADLIAFEACCAEKTIKKGSDIRINLTMLSEGEISYYRISQTLSGLLSAEWIPYLGECVFPGELVDENLINFSGIADILIQCKTDLVEMPIRIVSVDYSAPSLFYCSLTQNSIIKHDNIINVISCAYDSSSSIQAYFYLDGNERETERGLFYGDSGILEISCLLDPCILLNGRHELNYKLCDSNGNWSEMASPFYVDRPVPTSSEINILNENATVSENGSLQLDLSISNAKHLKTLNVKTGETVLYTKGYDDYKVDSLNESISVDCSALDSGEHYVTIELFDYTGNKTIAATDFFTVE